MNIFGGGASFEFDIRQKTQSKVEADFGFVARHKSSNMFQIVFLQIAKGRIGKKALYPSKGIKEYWQAYTDLGSGFFLDHSPGDTDPYANAVWKNGDWTDYNFNALIGNSIDWKNGVLALGPCSLHDTPGTDVRTEAPIVMEFQTAVIALTTEIADKKIDSPPGRFLGVFTWGITIPSAKNKKENITIHKVGFKFGLTDEIRGVIRAAQFTQGSKIVGIDMFGNRITLQGKAFTHTNFFGAPSGHWGDGFWKSEGEILPGIKER